VTSRFKTWVGFATVFGLLLLHSAAAGQKSPIIRNDAARQDTSGAIIDAHDGCLEQFGDTFYLYGTKYGKTDGFGHENRFVCYSAKDLVNWTYHGEILRDCPTGLYYRPHAIHNRGTGKYVMWYNWYPGRCCYDGRYGVAIADNPEGPFVIKSLKADVKHPISPGDHNLFVDDDGIAYLVYTVDTDVANIGHHRLCIERLTYDYLSTTRETSDFLAINVEAPAMFKGDGVYYVLFDNTCCFCRSGTGAQVYTAQNPLGPYVYKGNINRIGPESRGLSSPRTGASGGRPDCIVPAQQTHVAAIRARGGIKHIWMGDLWGSSSDGIKGHDLQYWSSPLEFYEDGMIKQLRWENNWSIDLP